MILIKIFAITIVCALAIRQIVMSGHKTPYQKWLEEENEKKGGKKEKRMKKIWLLLYVVCIVFVLNIVGLQFKTTSIEQIKESNYLGKTVIVEGHFVCDSVPMLVTDRKITLINTPMPYNQYVLLVGNKTKYMPTGIYDPWKLRVKGKVFPGYCGYEDEVVIEVFRYELAPSAWQYIQNRGTKIMDDGHISRPRIRRKSYVTGCYKSIRIRGSRVNTWLIYLVWEMYK